MHRQVVLIVLFGIAVPSQLEAWEMEGAPVAAGGLTVYGCLS